MTRPDLFPQRPVRSDFGRDREPVINLRRLFLLIALIGMAALVGVGVNSLFQEEEASDGEIPTIKAEGLLKERPEQPGGLDVPHQDVTVFQKIDGTGSEEDKAGMENLLPPPDTPQPVPQTEALASSVALPDAEADKPVLATSTPTAQTESLPPPITNAEPVTEPEKLIEDTKSAVLPKTEERKPDLSKTVEKKAEEKKEMPIKTETVRKVEQSKNAEAAKADQAMSRLPKELFTTGQVPAQTAEASSAGTKKAESAAVVATVSGKTARVQLASLPDQATAQSELKKLGARYAAVLGGTSLTVVRADLGAKGTYYRVMSAPLPEAKAKAICADLTKQKASCLVAR